MDIEVARLDSSAGGKLVSERRTLLKADRLDNRSGRIVSVQDLDPGSPVDRQFETGVSPARQGWWRALADQLDNHLMARSSVTVAWTSRSHACSTRGRGVLAICDGLRLECYCRLFNGAGACCPAREVSTSPTSPVRSDIEASGLDSQGFLTVKSA